MPHKTRSPQMALHCHLPRGTRGPELAQGSLVSTLGALPVAPWSPRLWAAIRETKARCPASRGSKPGRPRTRGARSPSVRKRAPCWLGAALQVCVGPTHGHGCSQHRRHLCGREANGGWNGEWETPAPAVVRLGVPQEGGPQGEKGVGCPCSARRKRHCCFVAPGSCPHCEPGQWPQVAGTFPALQVSLETGASLCPLSCRGSCTLSLGVGDCHCLPSLPSGVLEPQSSAPVPGFRMGSGAASAWIALVMAAPAQ